MNADKINEKIDVTWKAVALFEKNGKVSIPDLIKETGKTASDLYSLFPNKNAILDFYYPALVYQYWAMIEEIEGFEEFEISEKLSNFIYTMFDMLSEHHHFVEKTFKKRIYRKGSQSAFHKEIKDVFQEFLTSDADIAVSAGFFMKEYYYSLLASQYLFLITVWLDDNTEDKERTLALTDRLTSLYQEIVYNKTVDKTVDLVRYLVGGLDMKRTHKSPGECLDELLAKTKKHKKDDHE